MKIQKITLENITAFEGKHVIDFSEEPLRSAPIFAITGNTGAGKSTLLDAITLALYADTPRLHGLSRIDIEELKTEDEQHHVQLSDVRNMMRRGAKDARVAVEFMMHDEALYEATWNCSVKRTGKLNDAYRTLRRLYPDRLTLAEGKTKDVQPVINTLIGLDYEQFSRTVTLAQGGFAAFLLANQKDKSALLEKLTGTEIYGKISQLIYEHTREAKQRVSDLEHRIDGLLENFIQTDELNAITHEKSKHEALLLNLNEELNAVEKQLQWVADFEQAKADIAAKERAKQEANRQFRNQDEARNRLERYDKVLPMQADYQALCVKQDDLLRLQKEEERFQNDFKLAQQKNNDTSQKLQNANNLLKTLRERLAQLTPALNEGKGIVGEMREMHSQEKRLETLHEEAKKQLTLRRGKHDEKKRARTEIETRLAQLRHTEESMQMHHALFDAIELVNDKLKQYQIEEKNMQADQIKKQQYANDCKRLSLNLEKQQSLLQDNQAKLDNVQHELHQHQQALQNSEGVSLQSKVATINTRILSLKHAQTAWLQITNGFEEIAEMRNNIARHKAQLDQHIIDINRLENLEEKQRDAYERANEALVLSSTKDIKNLRKHLKEGTPCPLCGGTHHPYHTETEQELGAIAQRLKTDAEDTRAAWEQMYKKLEELRAEKATIEGTLTTAKDSLSRLEQRQTKHIEDWAEYASLDGSFKQCAHTTNHEARQAQLQLLLENAELQLKSLETQLADFNLHQNQITHFSTEANQLVLAINSTNLAMTELQLQLNIKQAEAEAAQQRIQQADQTCKVLYNELDKLITLNNWFDAWHANPDNYRRQLSEMATNWKNTILLIGQEERSLSVCQEELNAAADNQEEAIFQENNVRSELATMRANLKEKEERLHNLLGSRRPEQIEDELLQKIHQQELATETTRAQAQTQEATLSHLQGQLAQLQHNRQRTLDEKKEVQTRLDHQINIFNADNSPLQPNELRTLFAPTNDWVSLRKHLEQLRNAIKLSEHELLQAQNHYLDLKGAPQRLHEEAGETLETLHEQHLALKQRIDALENTLTDINQRLYAHQKSEAAAKAHAEELATLKNDAEEWSRLNTLIGSADGQRFRNIAQSYTFSYLVAQANLQLRHLSTRYELYNVPGSLTLEIIDRDLYDRRRYVSSLSGGETFVVSLALALALASLSAGNLTIGSLFIDEGFGNLDSASLDIVMNALSNLENNEGRKVGVVSHTEQIRTRIAPQIHVKKQTSSGKSHIEIY